MKIVCTIDNSYVQHCAVMLKSLCCYNSNVNVFIIHNGLTKELTRKLEKFLKPLVECLSFIKIHDSLLSNCPISHHISIATYFRLFIPEVISQDIDKVLFLDADIIIRKNIQSFWETDVRNYSHAAIEAPKKLEDKRRLGIPSNSKYFNAGVLLINLKFWREQNIFTKSLNFVVNNFDKIVWWDQDVLNYLLYKHVLIVDPVWNVQRAFWNKTFSEPSDVHVDREALSDPAILHFSGGWTCKPWHYYCIHPFREEYRQILSQTPWRRAPLEGKPPIIRQVRSKLKTYIRKYL